MEVCGCGCICVSDPRFIQFALGSCYAVHINAFKCTSNGTTYKWNEYDSVKNIDFVDIGNSDVGIYFRD